MRRMLWIGVTAVLLSMLRAAVAQPRAAQASAGLAVHLGCTDGALEAELAADGTRLVHALAINHVSLNRAREGLISKGVYGLASVEPARDLKHLPYADNLVNTLIADLDLLKDKAPTDGEIDRILCPGGRAHLRIGGKWTVRMKPRPAGMDEWTHFDHGADGNGVSRDRLIGPPTLPQWLTARQPLPREGNPAAYSTATAFRCAGGRVFHGWYQSADAKNARRSRQDHVVARDAFNGLPLWDVKTARLGRLDWQTLAGDDRLFTFVEARGFPVAIDTATGKIVTSFLKGGRLTDPTAHTMLRYAQGTLIETAGDTVYALDGRSGALRWIHTEAGGVLLFPSIDVQNGKVFALAAAPKSVVSDRWPCAIATAVVCLDFLTGKMLWRCDQIAGLHIGQMIPAAGKVALFGAVGIGGGSKDSGLVAALDAGSGNPLWKYRIAGGSVYSKQIWGLNMLIRDGSIYYATPWHLYRMDLATGERFEHWISSYNQRCNRFAATEKWFIMGLGTFIDGDAIAHINTIARSGCAQGPALANGMCYYTPNHCGCIPSLRGHLALCSEAVGASMADENRLEAFPAGRTSGIRPTTRPTGAIVDEWTTPDAPLLETPPVAVGDEQLVAVIHEHRLERRDASGKVRWAFVADGRIAAAPVVWKDLCFFAARDGYVYCLKVEDGSPQWRFFAAAYPRKMIAYGQIESSWPLFNVVLHEGRICGAAGHHPEIGGGMLIWGLEPRTGKVAWKRVLSHSHLTLASREKRPVAINQLVNGPLQSTGDGLKISGFVFRPTESEAEINARLTAKLKK